MSYVCIRNLNFFCVFRGYVNGLPSIEEGLKKKLPTNINYPKIDRTIEGLLKF